MISTEWLFNVNCFNSAGVTVRWLTVTGQNIQLGEAAEIAADWEGMIVGRGDDQQLANPRRAKPGSA